MQTRNSWKTGRITTFSAIHDSVGILRELWKCQVYIHPLMFAFYFCENMQGSEQLQIIICDKWKHQNVPVINFFWHLRLLCTVTHIVPSQMVCQMDNVNAVFAFNFSSRLFVIYAISNQQWRSWEKKYICLPMNLSCNFQMSHCKEVQSHTNQVTNFINFKTRRCQSSRE